MSSKSSGACERRADDVMDAGGTLFVETEGGPVGPILELYDVLDGIRGQLQETQEKPQQ